MLDRENIDVMRCVHLWHMALHMAPRARRPYVLHARVPGQSFMRAFFAGLAFSQFDHPRFDPPRYPRNARSEDMARIGADMWRAFRIFDEKEERALPGPGRG